MGYQAPVVLLIAVMITFLACTWFWRQQISIYCSCPCLVLMVRNQEEFIESLLRSFLLWCYWNHKLWRLVIICHNDSLGSLAILHRFLKLYPSCELIYQPGKNSYEERSFDNSCKRVYLLNISDDNELRSALLKLRGVYRENGN